MVEFVVAVALIALAAPRVVELARVLRGDPPPGDDDHPDGVSGWG